MKIIEVIDRVNKMKPNAIDQDELVSHLNDLESNIVLEVLNRDTYIDLSIDDVERELQAPSPYTRIYLEYLESIIDKYNEDIESYSMSSRVFNQSISDLQVFVRKKGLDTVSSNSFINYF